MSTTEAPRGSGTPRLTASARWALAALSLCMLMPSLDTSIANVGLPTLSLAFSASFQHVQWIVLAYLLATTSLIVGAGRLGDIVGRRRLLLAGIGVFTVASVACGLAPALWVLIVARAAQGLAAMMMSLSMALVGETVPAARIGTAMGLLGTMSAAGTTLGPSLGGILIASVGWRSIFLVNVPLGILNFVLALRSLPADQRAKAGPRAAFDVAGTLVLILTLVAYALAMTTGRGSLGMENILLLSAAAIGLLIFRMVERRSTSPLLAVTMFHDRARSAGLVSSALVSTVLMATLVVGPFYLSRALGLGPARVGFVMSIGPLMAALCGVLAGRIVDRFGAYRMAVTGLAGISAGLLALALVPGRFGVAGYIGAIVIVTGNYALFQAANNTAIMTGVLSGERGVVAGMLGLSRNFGLITGVSVMGAVFAFASSTTNVATAGPTAIAAGMQGTFTAAALLAVLALAVVIRSRKPHALDLATVPTAAA